MSSRARGVLCLISLWGCSEGAPSSSAPTDSGALTDSAAVADAGALTADSGEPAGDGGPDTRPQTLTHRMGPWMVPAGGERAADCESWTLHNEEPLYLSTVEMTATAPMRAVVGARTDVQVLVAGLYASAVVAIPTLLRPPNR